MIQCIKKLNRDHLKLYSHLSGKDSKDRLLSLFNDIRGVVKEKIYIDFIVKKIVLAWKKDTLILLIQIIYHLNAVHLLAPN